MTEGNERTGEARIIATRIEGVKHCFHFNGSWYSLDIEGNPAEFWPSHYGGKSHPADALEVVRIHLNRVSAGRENYTPDRVIISYGAEIVENVEEEGK